MFRAHEEQHQQQQPGDFLSYGGQYHNPLSTSGEKILRLIADGETELLRQGLSQQPSLVHSRSPRSPHPSGVHFAAQRGRVSCLLALLDTGEVDIENKDDDGDTACHHAARWGQRDTMKALLMRGADPLARNNGHHTPAEVCWHEDIREMLWSAGLDSGDAAGSNGYLQGSGSPGSGYYSNTMEGMQRDGLGNGGITGGNGHQSTRRGGTKNGPNKGTPPRRKGGARGGRGAGGMFNEEEGKEYHLRGRRELEEQSEDGHQSLVLVDTVEPLKGGDR